MNYAGVNRSDIANGTGMRTSVFVSGCRHACKGCFNSQAWSFDYGEKFDDTIIECILETLSPSYVAGLTILGGEPLEPENQPDVLTLVKRVRQELPEKSIWLYTGFTYEELTGRFACRAKTPLLNELLDSIDVLVDGKFEIELKDARLKFRGSSNQRLIDLKATRASGRVVTID